MDSFTLVLVTIIVINIRVIVVKICDTINKHSNKKELTAQSNKQRG